MTVVKCGREMVDDEAFDNERLDNVEALRASSHLREMALSFVEEAGHNNYSYNFDWLGLPIIQFPPDIVAVQELIWQIRPAVVVETGIARGGSLSLSASILELLGGDRLVLGIDIDIRPHNRRAIEAHPLAHRIELLEGSSVDPRVVRQVEERIRGRQPVLVLLDSMHTHDHVLRELELYSPFVQAGSYLVAFDTIIEYLPSTYFPDRPWGVGNNPKTAVDAFLRANNRFEVDESIEAKLLITVAPGGYLRCVG
jgi:cephalosporin hydroxylase